MPIKNKAIGSSYFLLALGLSLMAVPAVAADFTLEIFGNANMDDSVDEADISYIEGIINGSQIKTELADANNDSIIDEKDIEQAKLIIDGKEKTISFLDCDGVAVTITKPLKTVVASGDSAVEAVRVLQAGDEIVGIDQKTLSDFKSFLADLESKPSVGATADLDAEKIIELKPDVVILGPREWHDKELEKKLEGTNIQVVRLWLANTDIVLAQVMILGYVLDKKDEAKAYREWHDSLIGKFKQSASTIPQDKLPRAFWDRPGKTTCGGESSYQGTLAIAGGKNIAEDLGKYPEVDPEWVLEQDPDVILGISFSGGYDSDNSTLLEDRYDEIIGTPGFDNLTAVKNGKVFVTHYIIQVNAGYPVGVAYLAKWLHPELFPDLDPGAIQEEYLKDFQGLDFDVKEHGAFVYEP
jgi:iron complex transport system substrate-binding protein